MSAALGRLLHAFFVDHLVALKGLRPSSVRSYRDTIRLWLLFVARDRGCAISRLRPEDLTFERTLGFLNDLETTRGNRPSTRNQRRAALRCFFGFLAERSPELLHVCQRVLAIPMKRAQTPETTFLDRDEMHALLAGLPSRGATATRDRTLLMFLYNTGARAQEVADLRRGQLDLGEHPLVRLCGKGGKWRVCPLWQETARLLRLLCPPPAPDAEVGCAPVFLGRGGRALTRFGIYKLVRRHAAHLDRPAADGGVRRISPHVFRHTAAVQLLEAGIDLNSVRNWLGHAHLFTTNRYAEISTRAKAEALRACEFVPDPSEGSTGPSSWRTDEALLTWLASL